MPINAFKNGVTEINENNMNALIVSQDFSFIFEGAKRDEKAGAGTTENSLASYNYCARFTLTGATTLGRVELELDKDGAGQDVTMQIRSGMVPGSGTDGTLLKEVVWPKEFIGSTAGIISIPINLTGLTAGAKYWIVLKKAGDASNKIDWVGEASQDGSYPAYRRSGTTGNWTAVNALRFKVYSNEAGITVKHSIYGTNEIASYTYDANGLITSATRYIPPADGSAGGVREIYTVTMSGDYITGGEVS